MKKIALLVGINKYPNFDNRDLSGCVNDNKLLASALIEKFNFSEDEIKILNDEMATRKAIIHELKRIYEMAETDDVVVFHFSGHGTIRNSFEPDRVDGLEKTLVTYGSGPTPELDEDIRDSELRDWVALLAEKTKNIIIILDNCHSGSFTRREEKARRLETDVSKELSLLSAKAKIIKEEDLFSSSSLNWLSLGNYYSMLTACQKMELAREYRVIEGDKINDYGAFTYFLVKELLKAPVNSTYQDIFEQLQIKMQAENISQNPQLEGKVGQGLFSGTQINVMQYVLIKERNQNKVTIRAGAAHDITPNSKWAVYPPGTKNASPENKIGSIAINEIDSVTSVATITEENDTNKIEAGCRVIEEVHFFEDKKKNVFIKFSQDLAKNIKGLLSQDIKESTWVKLTDSETDADFIVSVFPSNPLDLENKLIKIKILQANARKLVMEFSNSSVNEILKIRQNLEKLCRYSSLLALENSASELKDVIEFILLQRKNGEWLEAESEYRNLPLYTEGDQIAFQVVNKSPYPIYISVLDFGLSKKISLLYPLKAPSEGMGSQIVATEQNPDMGTLKVGLRSRDEITLYIPDSAILSKLPAINKKGGIEVFRLIATTQPTNVEFLEQDGMRVTRAGLTSIENLFYQYSSEQQTREASVEVDAPNDWTVINRGFYLVKK